MSTEMSTDANVKVVGDIEFPPRKVWIKTYGCQMNYHDTERIVSHLEGLNFFLLQLLKSLYLDMLFWDSIYRE